MQAQWRQTRNPAPLADGPLLMDAALRPNRSLSAKSFLIFMLGFSSLNAALAIGFALQGAWPVIGFLVLDVVLLAVAFQMNYRSGRLTEEVAITRTILRVTRTDPGGRPQIWEVSPLWARASADDRAILISAAGKAMRIGAFLSPAERRAFAAALERALEKARR